MWVGVPKLLTGALHKLPVTSKLTTLSLRPLEASSAFRLNPEANRHSIHSFFPLGIVKVPLMSILPVGAITSSNSPASLLKRLYWGPLIWANRGIFRETKRLYAGFKVTICLSNFAQHSIGLEGAIKNEWDHRFPVGWSVKGHLSCLLIISFQIPTRLWN